MKTRVSPSKVKEFVIKVHHNDCFEFEKILAEKVSGIELAFDRNESIEREGEFYLEQRVNQNTYYTLLDLDSFTIANIIAEMTKRCGK